MTALKATQDGGKITNQGRSTPFFLIWKKKNTANERTKKKGLSFGNQTSLLSFPFS